MGIAGLGANLDEDHEVSLIDLIRKRRSVRQYLQRPRLRGPGHRLPRAGRGRGGLPAPGERPGRHGRHRRDPLPVAPRGRRRAPIVDNYTFLKEIGADTSYCQILTPYPRTGIRQHLLDEGLVTNPDDFSTYNGIWANVRARHPDADTLQYLVWYHRHQVMGWWEPSRQAGTQGRLWTGIWLYLVRPVAKLVLGRRLRRIGWRGRYEREIARLGSLNRFADLES